MPINNLSQATNWTIANNTQGAGMIISTVNHNMPGAFTFFLILFYIVLYIYMQDEPGRKKYLYITFVGMIVAAILGLFKDSYGQPLVPIATLLASVGMFIITMLFVIATSD
jgi:F0F1-type ATP synthase membrane subunit a